MRFPSLPKVGAVLLLAVSSVIAQNELEDKPVRPEELYAMIDEADEIVVMNVGPFAKGEKEEVLFKSGKPEDIAALKKSLQIKTRDGWFHCMCYGTEKVVLKRGGKELVELSNHHGRSVRTSLWSSDAMVADSDAWVQWFADRGMNGPKDELLESRARAEQSEKDYAKWQAAMPPLIRPVWDSALDDSAYGINSELLAKAIAKQGDTENILELLEWFGSGAGPWSGFPSYEQAGEDLLLKYPTPMLLDVIQKRSLTKPQTEGAARLLGGWGFHSTRPEDAKLPESLRKTLWEHCKDTKDRDKFGRAKKAFSDAPEK